MPRQLGKPHTQDTFVEKAIEVHGEGRYDYSKAIYSGCFNKLTIICNQCKGEFFQSPAKHLSGQGCSGCNRRKGQSSHKHKVTQELFIAKAKEKHGDKYCYDLVKFRVMREKVQLKCKCCSLIFEISPHHHIHHGNGCPDCGKKQCSDALRLTFDDFVKNCVRVHGTKYNYNKVKYIDNSTKVTIICSCGEEFEQTPSSHMNGNGCRKCAFEKNAESLRKDTTYFIQKAISVHGKLYDYSEVDYFDIRSKVKIKCNSCKNSFMQSPGDHYSGCGCPFCKQSKGERAIQNILDTLDLIYTTQHSFDDCKHNRPLRFDFFIPALKIAIEYDGKQHFEPIEYFGGQEGFEKRQLCDAIKNRYCEANNIKLLRVPYTETDIERCIKQFLISL